MYYNSDKFIQDIFTLKNTTVFITDLVEYELSSLDIARYKYIKGIMNKNNVKVVVIKEETDKKFKVGRCIR